MAGSGMSIWILGMLPSRKRSAVGFVAPASAGFAATTTNGQKQIRKRRARKRRETEIFGELESSPNPQSGKSALDSRRLFMSAPNAFGAEVLTHVGPGIE